MIELINYSQVMSPLSYVFYMPKHQLRKTSVKKVLKFSIEDVSIHNGKLFSQINGVAMDNLLGPTLANWFLGMIEKEIFNQNLSFYPSCYVDNVFALFSLSADAPLFLNVLINLHTNLRFLLEEASNPSYHFLMLK